MDKRQRAGFVRSMREIADGVEAGSMKLETAVKRLRDGADWLEPLADGDGGGPTSAQIREVFEHWKRETGRPKTILTDGRRQKIKARLRKRPVEALCHIISWATRHEFHSRHDTIGSLFLSDDRVEDYLSESGWLERAPKPVHVRRVPPREPTQMKLEPPPEKPVSLADYLAEHPEYEAKSKALKSIMGFREGNTRLKREPASIGKIVSDMTADGKGK